MKTVVTYAVRSGILLEDSLIAIDVAGETTVQKVRAEGVALEARALLRALRIAGERGVEDATYTLSHTLHAALGATGKQEKSISDLKSRLRHQPQRLEAAESPLHLEAVLEAAPYTQTEWTLDPEDAAWVAERGATVVYTDGSCATGMVGAWAWYVDDTRYASGQIEHVAGGLTAERRAIQEALKAHPGPVLVLSDHEYAVTSFDAILDAAGIEDQLEATMQGRDVRVRHVKGHADCVGNLKADRLAGKALQGRLKALEEDPVLRLQHEASAAEVVRLTWDRQEARRKREKWCSVRRRELIDAQHPDWDRLSQPERKQLGGTIHLQALKEYAALNG